MAKAKTAGKGGSGSALGRALDLLGTIIIVVAILLALTLTMPRFFGISSYTVLTGSMEPTIPVGSLVFSKYTDPVALSVGDIVVFYDGTSSVPITHRIIGNQVDEGTITTQGDANPMPDMAPIYYQNIIGKVILHIPGAGKILIPLGSMQGKLSLCAIILGALLLSMAGRTLSRRQ